MSTVRTTLALAAVMVAVSCAARAADATPAQPAPHVEKRIVIHAGDQATTPPDPASIPGDHLRIDDLATLQAGDTRTYTTEGGNEVTVTAKGNGVYALTLGDHTIQIGGTPEADLAGLPGGARVVVKKNVQSDGKVTEDRQVIVGAPGEAAVTVDPAAPATVITIVEEKDGKQDQRVIVLRTDKKPAH